jgi:hypothetical protein
MAEAQKKKIVLVHYHLRRGGVTRVIDAAAKVLEARGHQVLILTGKLLSGTGKRRLFAWCRLLPIAGPVAR